MGNKQNGSAGANTRASLVRLWIPPCGLALVIIALSSTPGSYYPEHPDFLNNAAHFMEFALLSFLLGRVFNLGYSMGNANLFLWAVVICASFGFLDEVHQFLVPERVFDLMDLVFDLLGAAAGSAAWLLHKALNSDRTPASTVPGGKADD